MDLYFVSKIPLAGEIHMIHLSCCLYLPEISERIYLGYFIDYDEAVAEAKTIYHFNADVCRYCCPDPPHDGRIVFL